MAGTPAPPFLVPLEELRQRLAEAERAGGPGSRAEVGRLRGQLEDEARRVTASLTPWQQCLLARHSDRPYCLDYVRGLFTDWVEIHGDRGFADDPAIVAGLGRFDGESVAVVGHQKGRDTRERLYRNFGQPKPEGYRKALRVMHMAEKFGRPIISLVDTQGASPGLDAEERGQAEAIAHNLREMAALTVPIVVVVAGEGGSGGALAIGIGDRILMMEHAVYSVISPEGCAAILWKDQTAVQQAATALRLTAANLLELGIIDEIIPEPLGGAQMDPNLAIRTVGTAIRKALVDLRRLKREELPRRRFAKFRVMGKFVER
jgi:acetyl-CoA carboxylase carboxyl transferase subunit alpha